MRPEEIEELMHSMNQQKIEYVIKDESKRGDDSLNKLIEKGPD